MKDVGKNSLTESSVSSTVPILLDVDDDVNQMRKNNESAHTNWGNFSDNLSSTRGLVGLPRVLPELSHEVDSNFVNERQTCTSHC